MLKRFVAWRVWFLLAAVGLVVASGALFLLRTQGGVKPVAAQATRHPVNGAIEVEFGREVSAGFEATMQPAVPGKWQKHWGVFGVHELDFVPAKPLVPASTYRVRVSHLRAVTGQVLGDETLVVTTEAPASVASVSPAAGAVAVLPDAKITLRLGSPNRSLRRLSAVLSPGVALGVATSADDKTFSWKPQSALVQGQVYHLVVSDLNQTDPAKSLLYQGDFTVVPQPGVSGTVRDHFYLGDAIDIHFSEGMKPETVKFDMGMTGQGSWVDAATYHFVPTGLVAGRTYTYRVTAGALSARGGRVEADKLFGIATPGAAVVVGSGPGGSGVSRSAGISFTFDQPVDHASAQAHFSLMPGVAGTFTWSGNTMTYRSAGLDFQTGYAATVSAGVAAQYGLPSGRAYGVSFSTELEVVRLSAAYYHQPFTLSCEATSLRMALSHYGISASEGDIVAKAGYAPRPRDTATNSWDDPYMMFVGDINGTMGVTGWGVYAGPIAAAARGYGRDATSYTGVSVNFIAQQIHAGYPVVAWGTTTPVRLDSWYTGHGVVNAPRSEHARLIVGVTGRADAPVSFVIYDPIYGQFSWTPAQLSANLNSYAPDSNQVVVVR